MGKRHSARKTVIDVGSRKSVPGPEIPPAPKKEEASNDSSAAAWLTSLGGLVTGLIAYLSAPRSETAGFGITRLFWNDMGGKFPEGSDSFFWRAFLVSPLPTIFAIILIAGLCLGFIKVIITAPFKLAKRYGAMASIFMCFIAATACGVGVIVLLPEKTGSSGADVETKSGEEKSEEMPVVHTSSRRQDAAPSYVAQETTDSAGSETSRTVPEPSSVDVTRDSQVKETHSTPATAPPSSSPSSQFRAYQMEQVELWSKCKATPARYKGRTVNWAIKVDRAAHASGPGWATINIWGTLDDDPTHRVHVFVGDVNPKQYQMVDTVVDEGLAKGQWLAVTGLLTGEENNYDGVQVLPVSLRNHGYRDDL
ncbi:hypothetical protein ACXR0O_13945 [Verrucomicrobiota bacterium sgz303538]